MSGNNTNTSSSDSTIPAPQSGLDFSLDDVLKENADDVRVAADLDGDGSVDQLGLDLDGDGYVDTVVTDLDGDGEVDTIQLDTTEDTILDTTLSSREDVNEYLEESAGQSTTGVSHTQVPGDAQVVGTVDRSGDGVHDTVVLDLDGDGVADAEVSENVDGAATTLSLDTNKDGIIDEVYTDYDGDGVVDEVMVDYDYDGVADARMTDTDGDGYIDTYEERPGYDSGTDGLDV